MTTVLAARLVRVSLSALVAALVVLVPVRRAHAQADAEYFELDEPKKDTKRAEAEAARALREASAAANRRDWTSARDAYQSSYDTRPSAAALLGVARSSDKLGDFVAAWTAYTQVATRFPGVAKKSKVAEALDRLETKIAVIRLRFDPAAMSGTKLTVDGERHATDESPLIVRVNPGSHDVFCSRRDGAKFARHIALKAGESAEAFVVLTKPTTAAAPAKGQPSDIKAASAQAEVAPWNAPHGHARLVAAPATAAPKIDGILDDEVWKSAPQTSPFGSRTSTPFGRVAYNPTVVKTAFDEEYLYVAVVARYQAPGPRDESFPHDELGLVADSESVGVIVDGLHDHQNARGFFASRSGGRADIEYTDSGFTPNRAWRGIWWVATTKTDDAWTAEFKIPWATIGTGASDRGATIGVQFQRSEPFSAEPSTWSMMPPGTELFDTNYFGHLEMRGSIRPGRKLYLRPYLTGAVEQEATQSPSRLLDFTGTQGRARVYGGLYARYHPVNALNFDVTVNPDFSAVDPDSSVTNLDRFELQFDEVRPFFTEDQQRFAFGQENAALFYSRRLGIATTRSGLRTLTPVLGAVKGVYRNDGIEAAVMQVGLTGQEPRVSLDSNYTVLRTQKLFGQGRRLGQIFMRRAGADGVNLVTGVDGAYSFAERHFVVSGFAASSATEGQGNGLVGGADAKWESRDVMAGASHLTVGPGFDGSMGFLPLGNAQLSTFSAGYTPFIETDAVQQFVVLAKVQRANMTGGDRVFDRGSAEVAVMGLDDTKASVSLEPGTEFVAEPFDIAAGRIQIAPGEYQVIKGRFAYSTPDRARVFGRLTYTEGDLFSGYQRTPGGTLGLNLGRFSTELRNEVYVLTHESRSLSGYRLSGVGTMNYSSQATGRLVIETNTLNQLAVIQLVHSYSFGQGSSIMLTLRELGGRRGVDPVGATFGAAQFSAFLSIALGVFPW